MARDSGEYPPLDAAFDALANQYRRRLLLALLEHNPQDDDDTQVPVESTLQEDDLDELRVRMTHAHLPKLEEAGFVDWDRDSNEIKTGPRFDDIRPILRLMAEHAEELPEDWR